MPVCKAWYEEATASAERGGRKGRGGGWGVGEERDRDQEGVGGGAQQMLESVLELRGSIESGGGWGLWDGHGAAALNAGGAGEEAIGERERGERGGEEVQEEEQEIEEGRKGEGEEEEEEEGTESVGEAVGDKEAEMDEGGKEQEQDTHTNTHTQTHTHTHTPHTAAPQIVRYLGDSGEEALNFKCKSRSRAGGDPSLETRGSEHLKILSPSAPSSPSPYTASLPITTHQVTHSLLYIYT